MGAHTAEFDLASLRLGAGEARRLALQVSIVPLRIGGLIYRSDPQDPRAQLEVSRMLGGGYALHLRFSAALTGPCMRCLNDAAAMVEVDSREIDKAGAGEELDSPYVHEEMLDLAAWARDALALTAPVQVLCRDDCAGLCPTCAADLNEVGSDHHHDSGPDPRWAKLRELKLE